MGEQLHRLNHKILRRETKTEAPLPLPDICVAALKLRKKQQDAARRAHSERWTDTGLVFTTRYGTPIEPRNFNSSFDYRVTRAAVRRINVHGTRKTCGTLLAALDVHPRVAKILRHSRIAVAMEIYTEGDLKSHQRRPQASWRRAEPACRFHTQETRQPLARRRAPGGRARPERGLTSRPVDVHAFQPTRRVRYSVDSVLSHRR